MTCKPDSVGCYHLSGSGITAGIYLLTLPDIPKGILPGRQKIGVYIAFQHVRFTHAAGYPAVL